MVPGRRTSAASLSSAQSPKCNLSCGPVPALTCGSNRGCFSPLRHDRLINTCVGFAPDEPEQSRINALYGKVPQRELLYSIRQFTAARDLEVGRGARILAAPCFLPG